ncbi:NAD-dependent epimerase/dehydratase family protein [Nocardia sp. NPDC050713]|uniref:NAD-dependent epimerase/dehydratase family protein n=1 Tax=Nocardia sp. NPDC050713 TaxID=3154511 RepID=UPI0033C8B945
MKVVVTGASGNVGTALLRALRAEDWEIVGVVRRPPAERGPYARARWVRCDIGAPGAVGVLREAFADADAVVHLAWAIHPRSGEPLMERTNLAGSANVLRAVADCGVRHLTCASSVAAYAPAPRWQRVDEAWPSSGVPGSAYSRGKAVLEALLDGFAVEHPGVRVARIRPCGVTQAAAAAELADWASSPWLPRILIGHRWLPIPLWKDLRLQLVHSEDVAAALRLILTRQASGPYNLAAEPVLTTAELAATFGGFRLPVPLPALTAAAWASWRLGVQPLHPGWLELADRACLIDTAKARRELGWAPRHPADAVAAELAEGLRTRRTGDSPPLAPARARPRLGHPTHQTQAFPSPAPAHSRKTARTRPPRSVTNRA